MDLEEIRRISIKKGVGQKFICKEERLTNLLTQLYILFKEEIILKGGTGLNRAFLYDKGRFSEDIDLDIITRNQSETISYLEKKSKKIQGFDIKKPRLMNRTLRFDCYYMNELDQKDKIQIEFYIGHERIIGETILKAIHSPIIEQQATVFNIYTFESLIARKIIALTRREEGKDLYDLLYSLKKNYDKKKLLHICNELCEFYNIINIKKELKKQFEIINKNIKYIGNSTNHYIIKENSLGWSFIAEETERILMSILD